MTASRGGSPSGRCGETSRCTNHMVGNPWHARPVSDLTDLRARMRSFTAERDWERLNDPKSLLLALVGEIGELSMGVSLWLPRAGEPPSPDQPRFEHNSRLNDSCS